MGKDRLEGGEEKESKVETNAAPGRENLTNSSIHRIPASLGSLIRPFRPFYPCVPFLIIFSDDRVRLNWLCFDFKLTIQVVVIFVYSYREN